MKKTICTFVIVSLIAVFATMNAYADTINLRLTGVGGSIAAPEGGTYASYMRISDTVNGIDFVGFCADYDTPVSTAYQTSKGQDYNYAFLPEDAFFSKNQINQIQSLFDHVYATAFSPEGALRNVTAANAIQMALWSIINDDTSMGAGSAGRTLANQFLAALDADNTAVTWDSIGYGDATDTTLVIFRVPGGNHVSQSLISANYMTGGYGTPNPTPEPATLLILGLGAIGAGFAARRRMSK